MSTAADETQFAEVDGPGPGAVEVEVEGFRTLTPAPDDAGQLEFDQLPLRDSKTGELFVVSVTELRDYLHRARG
jgi:hypothetical protein